MNNGANSDAGRSRSYSTAGWWAQPAGRTLTQTTPPAMHNTNVCNMIPYAWLVFGSCFKYIYIYVYIYIFFFFSVRARTPRIPQIGRERRPRTHQISSNRQKKSLIVEAGGVGDRLATLRVSRAKVNFQYKTPSKSQPRTLCYAIVLQGRKSGVRPGCRPDSNREGLKIGPTAG